MTRKILPAGFFFAGFFVKGKRTCSVNFKPNGTEIIESALIAQPFAFSTGAKLRRRSFIHAIIILGPLMMSKMQTKMIRYCHHGKSFIPSPTFTNAVPIIPNAIPMAAKIPANLAISKADFFSAFGSAAVATFAVMSSNVFASFSAADLLILSSTHFAILRYGFQNA